VQQNARGKSSHGSYDDMLRLFAAMEAVPWQYRQEMGQWMLQRLRREDETVQTWWAIGRLAARQSLAANAHLVMPPEAALEFLNATLAQDWRKNETAMFAAVQMARMTGDRARDLPDEIRAQVLEKMRDSGAPQRWMAWSSRWCRWRPRITSAVWATACRRGWCCCEEASRCGQAWGHGICRRLPLSKTMAEAGVRLRPPGQRCKNGLLHGTAGRQGGLAASMSTTTERDCHEV
jgi:hypothetical protein